MIVAARPVSLPDLDHRLRYGLAILVEHADARLDNNVMERHLKLIVRNRKNANYFKTAVGAAIGDVITSVIATSASAGINVLDYLNAIQRNQAAVKENPCQWLPWNYPQSDAA